MIRPTIRRGRNRRLAARSFRERNPVVIGISTVLALGLLTVTAAVAAVLSLGTGLTGYTMSGVFAETGDTRLGTLVFMSGVRVGAVTGIKPDFTNSRVIITWRVENSAKIFRKSALGESQVLLEPVAGTDPGGPRMRGGDRIPISRTSPAPDYDELLRNTGRLLAAAKPDAIQTVVHELAVGLTGRGQSLRAAITATDRLTGTLAANTGTLDALFTDATGLAHDLAASRGEVGRTFDNLAAFSKQMRASRREVEDILARGPGLLARIEPLAGATAADMGCLIEAGGSLADDLGSAQTVRLLRQFMAALPHASRALGNVMDYQDGKPYLRLVPTLGITAPEHPKTYLKALPAPKPPQLPGCPGAKKKIKYPDQVLTSLPDPYRPPASRDPGTGTTRAQPVAGGSPADQNRDQSAELWLLAAGITAAAVLGAMIGLAPWRIRRTGSGDTSTDC